ncbi:PEP-CTERM sorting domain-containing protein [Citrifermentans bremense]|nr:PEP-CTERM sorting domain-containing protein [Citrifermentans bremense]
MPESVVYQVSYLGIEDPGTNPVPEPSTFLLFGSALATFGFYVRRRRNI